MSRLHLLLAAISLAAPLLFVPHSRIAAAEPEAKPVPDAAEKTPATAPTVGEVARQAGDSIAVITVGGRDGGQAGLGTGFVISANGLIATNLHVIGEARPISVQLADGRKVEVTEVHASDRTLDLAVIRIAATNLKPLLLGDSLNLEKGLPIVVLGNPHGLKHSVVGGVISGTREVEGREMLQLAIPIEPGNSGGPVVDFAGRVLGIVTMKSLVTNNLGFAVGVNDLKPLLEKPNPVPMARWLTIGTLDAREWTPLFGARWQQRAGRILVSGTGSGFGGRSICLSQAEVPNVPFEVATSVRLTDESGAAGLVFHADGQDRHYGFYPSNGKLRLSRFDGPDVFSWKVLQEVPSEFYRPGQWNYLKVRVEKDKLSCFVNEHLVIESTDGDLTSGKVGLAKFRQTEAEFKQFEVARKIASHEVPPAEAEKIARDVEQLPDRPQLRDEQLAPLAAKSPASMTVLREQAKELEARAEALRQLAQEVHVAHVAAELAKLMQQDEDQIDLARAALLIAWLDDDELDVAAYLKEFDRMTAQIKESLAKDADEAARLAALGKYLFADNGFHGSRHDYYHKANSYLNRVLDDREGLPITLAVLYMELGRRLGLNIQGVGLPGHFVVKHVPPKGAEQLIDVFEGAEKMTRADAADRVMEITGRTLIDKDLAPSTKRQIAERMLGNLMGIAQRAEDKPAMLRYAEALVAIDPESVPHRGMRAVLRSETGRRDAAVADLDWFLEHKPEGIDLDQIRQMREYFQHRK